MQTPRHRAYRGYRIGLLTTLALVASLLVGGLVVPASAAAARTTAARAHVSRALLDPTLTVSPAAAGAGGEVTVSGGGFAANETVTLAFDGNLTYSSRVQATAAGQVPASAFTVPAVSGPGAHKIVATGAASRRVATAAVAVESATIVVSPAVASPGERITVSGGGFAANETVTLAFDGNLTYSVRVQTTAAGQVPANAFTVPAVSGPGAHKIVATGAASRRRRHRRRRRRYGQRDAHGDAGVHDPRGDNGPRGNRMGC